MDRFFHLLVLAQENLPGAGGAPAGPAPAPGGGGGGTPPSAGGGYEQILFLVLMIVIFYFLLIRPQQKQRKKHQALITSLKAGDSVITTSGIFGRIVAIDDSTATIEIAKGTRIKVLKNYVGGMATPETEKELAQTPPA